DQRGTDYPGFVHADELAPATSLIAFVGETVVVGAGRFVPEVLLDRVIDVEPVRLGENLAEVGRALGYVHWRRGREGVLIGTGVRRRNQGQQSLDSRVAGGLGLGDLCRGQGSGWAWHCLALAQPLITQ